MTRENKAEKRNLQNCKSYFESVIEDMNNFYNNKQDEYELGGLFNYFLWKTRKHKIDRNIDIYINMYSS